MKSARVREERRPGVLTIVLDRPRQLNVLDEDMIADIAELIERARVDPEVRCVVLRGEGRAFCAGDDLARRRTAEYGPDDVETKLKTSYVRPVLDLLRLRKPTVAVMQGYALGAGFDLALACDFRVASADLEVGATVVRWGLGGACAYLLPKYLGVGRATEMLLLGDRYPIADVASWGLATYIVETHELAGRVQALTDRLVAAPTASLGLIKTARNRGLGAGVTEGIEWQATANLELLLLQDPIEGREAWREKREPQFTGQMRSDLRG